MTNRPGSYPCFAGWPAEPELFRDPPEDFRPAAYWFWSREVDPATFRKKLEEMETGRAPRVLNPAPGSAIPWRNTCRRNTLTTTALLWL